MELALQSFYHYCLNSTKENSELVRCQIFIVMLAIGMVTRMISCSTPVVCSTAHGKLETL